MCVCVSAGEQTWWRRGVPAEGDQTSYPVRGSVCRVAGGRHPVEKPQLQHPAQEQTRRRQGDALFVAALREARNGEVDSSSVLRCASPRCSC